MIDPMLPVHEDQPDVWPEIDAELLARLVPTGGYYTPEQRVELNRIARGQWFLVRNDLRARCASCRQGILPGAVHEYVTTGCIELPFNGLREVSMFYAQHDQHGRLWGSLSMGTIAPISAEDAQVLNERIRARRRLTITQMAPLQNHELDAAALHRRIRRRAALSYRLD